MLRATSCTASATLEFGTSTIASTPSLSNHWVAIAEPTIRLVVMVGADQLDLLAVDAAAKIGDRHARRLDRPRPADIGVEARTCH